MYKRYFWMCLTHLIARVAFLPTSLMWALIKQQIIKFLAFFLMMMLVPANVMVSPKDGYFVNCNVECSRSVFPGLLLSITVPWENMLNTLLKGIESIIFRVVRVNRNINLTIVSIKHTVKITIISITSSRRIGSGFRR